MAYLLFLLVLCAVLAAAQEADGLSREQLKPLTSFRQQHRRTVLGQAWGSVGAVLSCGVQCDEVDGRLCAAAFVQDKRVYTGCTEVPVLHKC